MLLTFIMKLIFYDHGGSPHHKNLSAIKRMCNSRSIEFVYTTDINAITNPNYDILICNSSYVNPDIIPSTIKVIYGPQLFVLPSGPIVGPIRNDLVGRCVDNTLSKWIEDAYKESVGSLVVEISQFPFSVDTDKFCSYKMVDKTIDCILYIKRRSVQLISYVINVLNEKNLQYKVFKYGSYDENEYLSSLKQCKFMITLDAHESQGFALEEAMSCDVPLLVLDVTSMYDEMNDGYNSSYAHLKNTGWQLKATSVPYWSDTECGIRMFNVDELQENINKMMTNHMNYNPREYILNTLSDTVCMDRILTYFKLN